MRRLIAELEAAGDEPSALAVLGFLHQDGAFDKDGRVIVKPNPRSARRYNERGAALGDANAMLQLADDLTKAGARRASVRRGIALYERSFAKGQVFAGYNLAVRHRNAGRARLAVRWFKRCAAAGDPDALFQVAAAELYGTGTRRRPADALRKLGRIARARDPRTPDWLRWNAMTLIATTLLDGWIVKRDYHAALRWLRKASSSGSTVARAMLELHDAGLERIG